MTIETGGWAGTYSLVSLALGISPVFVFLVLLVYLDSYKLVRIVHIFRTILPGCAVALLCIGINRAGFELAVRAKGDLLKLEAGFDSPPDPEVKSKFEELGYLERSIGLTGKLALFPLLANSARVVWQLRHMGYK